MRAVSMADALLFRGEAGSRSALWKRATLSNFVDPHSESAPSDRHDAVCLFARAVVEDEEVGRALIAYDVLTGKVDQAALEFVDVTGLIAEYEKASPTTVVDHRRASEHLLPLLNACPVSYATLYCAVPTEDPLANEHMVAAAVDAWIAEHAQKCIVAWMTPEAALNQARPESFLPKLVLVEIASEERRPQFVAGLLRESDMRVVLGPETKFLRQNVTEIRAWPCRGQSLYVWTSGVDAT